MDTTTQQPSVQETFGAHHLRLERLFEEVLSTLNAGDARQACLLWSTLDRELTEHMALEERELLPRLAEHEPAAVQKLRAEHDELRRDLAELGAGIDLHRVTEPVAKLFFDRLHAHAAREDALLYRWADRQLRERGSLLKRFRQIVRG